LTLWDVAPFGVQTPYGSPTNGAGEKRGGISKKKKKRGGNICWLGISTKGKEETRYSRPKKVTGIPSLGCPYETQKGGKKS